MTFLDGFPLKIPHTIGVIGLERYSVENKALSVWGTEPHYLLPLFCEVGRNLTQP